MKFSVACNSCVPNILLGGYQNGWRSTYFHELGISVSTVWRQLVTGSGLCITPLFLEEHPILMLDLPFFCSSLAQGRWRLYSYYYFKDIMVTIGQLNFHLKSMDS